MAFKQLYYTSCETGLLGYGGFQFNAVTPGLSISVLREVEDLTSYEPPRDMPSDPQPNQLRDYPVAFSYSPGDAGSLITARTVFAGADYSGRPGNYFVHALVTDSADDYGPLLPVQLWDAPLWQAEPVPNTELPIMPGPPAQGPLDRASAQRLIQNGGRVPLTALLTAVGRAIAGEQPVLLVGKDSAANAAWIAAVSYLLGELAWRLSFTTYTNRPTYSRHHLIGVLACAGPMVPDQGFHVFDPALGRAPELAPHPLAALLARTGVLAAESLWSTAAGLASGQETGFEDWYPVLAAASVLAGASIEQPDVAAVVTWLGGDRGRSSTRVLAKLLDLAETPGGPCEGFSVTDLHVLGAQVSSETLRRRLDDLAVDEALGHLTRGEPAGTPVELYTGEARQRAAQEVLTAVRTLPPEENSWALALLEWAQDVEARPPAAALRQYGYSDFDPFAGDAPVLGQILSGQPDIVSGLIARLAEAPELARALLESPDRAAELTKVISWTDLGKHHELAELWLESAVTAGDQTPLAALDQIMKHRGPGGADADLLGRLWPDGCPADDLGQLLEQTQLGRVADWLAEQVTAALTDEHGSGQAAMLQALDARPDVRKRLQPEALNQVKNLNAVSSLVAKVKRGDTKALTQIYQAYPALDSSTAKKVRQEVTQLLARFPQLGLALHDCPPEVRTAFCKYVRIRLNVFNRDAELAARVFAAELDLSGGTKKDKAAADALGKEIMAVLDWRGGQLRAMRRALDERYVREFDAWQQENRRGVVRNLLRGFRKNGD